MAELHKESAKIYQFPRGGRPVSAARRDLGESAADAAALQTAKVVVGRGWYHEEAIQEDAPDTKK